MVNTYIKILFAGLLLIILASSCSKEEYSNSIELTDPSDIDTIILDEYVVLSTSGNVLELSGFYTQCNNQINTNERPEYTHLIAYAENLKITNGIGTWDGPLNVLYWTSSEDLKEGKYLVEGVYVDNENGTEEESALYNLTISEVTESSVVGKFETAANSLVSRTGEFRTSRYSCEELEIDGEDTALELVEYADGRMSLSINSGEEKLLMSAAVYCEDIFADRPGLAKLIYGGGAFYYDPIFNELDYDELPELLIVFDMDQVGNIEIGQNFRSYYLDDLEALFDSPDDPNYEDFIAMASPISVTIISESTDYLEGIYVGILTDGRKVEGTFRANISTGC